MSHAAFAALIPDLPVAREELVFPCKFRGTFETPRPLLYGNEGGGLYGDVLSLREVRISGTAGTGGGCVGVSGARPLRLREREDDR